MTRTRVIVLPKLNDVAATKKCDTNVIPPSCHSVIKTKKEFLFTLKKLVQFLSDW